MATRFMELYNAPAAAAGESTAVVCWYHDRYRAGGSKASEGIRKIAQHFGISATTVQRLSRQ